ncbi:hypothetical protein [Spirosoma radiotolerans]|uniref:3-keto-disaccharide hydrolase domain-containing protein n=1 Tax=Spirosoma radiotolerans TaxID=1379870 RepID=A0A0E3ZUT0_9BACT|nr:hypothetical protein [Spirosoma radiotolerans]AKD55730.1 hypothetical protein SD10_13285 [Spirosoma radiotolerans]
MNARLIALLLFVSSYTFGQTVVPFDSSAWVFAGKVTQETFQGKAGISLTNGSIYLKDSTFKNGSIEFDMTLSKERYFPGFCFRIQDKANVETVYLRPHQVGNPDAIQYMPVFNGQEAWQLYYGDGYSTAVTYPLNTWIHVKLLVRDAQAEVYIGNTAAPTLVIHHLKRPTKAGQISLNNDAPALTRFANFQYTKSDTPPMAGTFKPEPTPQPGTILTWQVSSPFDEKLLQTDYSLPQLLVNRLTWQTLTAENSGKLNLSRISKLSEGNNSVFAKVTIVSDKPQIKKLQLGFSDRAKVYVNGGLVYTGHDEFGSRDYRFLGTMGYFDAVYLALKKGPNDLWIAISETFGGWGLQAMMTDQTGLTINR